MEILAAQVLAIAADPGGLPPTAAEIQAVAAALNAYRADITRRLAGVDNLLGYLTIDSRLIAAMSLVAAVVVFGVRYLLRRQMQAAGFAFAAALEAVQAGDFSRRLDTQLPHEFLVVAERYHEMVAALAERQQRLDTQLRRT
ncbi:MAG: hypothetical protein HC876_23355, partial [Chloroflexaceae bacterium]|nr:hypothetical protein [Chloroflexaceae bacterium]